MILSAALILAVLFITGVVYAASAAAKDKDEGEMNMAFRNLYVYLVLFATLMMSIGGSVGVFMSAADYVSPPTYYQSYSDFKTMKEETAKKPLSEEQIKEQFDDAVAGEKQRAKENALNGIIKSLGWIVIPFPVFLYFQRQVRRKQE
ncbi:hypothetical protein GKZ89_11515 [Bacillus mangrovi]|uniref:DUF5671 domain-containing protein n=1 Tax=Metabacillus mangrovi TaxID=1491830 RepID=A0A7X2S745_9BACI|nr:hypothetical protein [Metabacillus mangrovi]MTH54036.1 hypothetical protein [Metabacillus mangrovi]